MNFLQLVQALQEESGSGGQTISSLANVTGESLRLKNWIRRANLAIQSQWVDWKFLWVEGASITTGAGTQDYAAPASTVNVWDRKSFKVDGEWMEPLLEYDATTFPISPGSGKPTQAYLLPSRQLRMEPTPNAAYTVTADYWRTPADLTDNSDVSLIPEPFRMVIVYQALMYYANWERAEEAKQHAREGLELWYPMLQARELPNHQRGTVSNGNDIQVVAE